MKTFELIAPCHFGLEAVLKKEILDLGYEAVDLAGGMLNYRGKYIDRRPASAIE